MSSYKSISFAFKGCSINNIVTEVGVNRFSLYHEFNNKEGILYASLKLYKERYCPEKFQILDNEGFLEDVLKDFYFSYLNEQTQLSGCYFIHIGTEMADEDAEIKNLVSSYLEEVEKRFIFLLIKKGVDQEEAELKARHLLGLYCTSMSFCLIHTKEKQLEHIKNGIHIILNNHDKSIT